MKKNIIKNLHLKQLKQLFMNLKNPHYLFLMKEILGILQKYFKESN